MDISSFTAGRSNSHGSEWKPLKSAGMPVADKWLLTAMKNMRAIVRNELASCCSR